METRYPYQVEAVLRIDYQKGRPIQLERVDKEAEREAEMVRRMQNFRSAFNPTCKGGKYDV